MSTYGQRFNMLLTLISATYSYPLSSDSQSTESTFFLDFWQQAAKWFSLLQFLQEAPHVGQFFFAKGCCLAQDLHMRSCALSQNEHPPRSSPLTVALMSRWIYKFLYIDLRWAACLQELLASWIVINANHYSIKSNWVCQCPIIAGPH